MPEFTGVAEHGPAAERLKATVASLALGNINGVAEVNYNKQLLRRLLAWVGATGVCDNPLLAGMDISALQEAVAYVKTGEYERNLHPGVQAKLAEARERIQLVA